MEASRNIEPIGSPLLAKGGHIQQLYVLLKRFRCLVEGREAQQNKGKEAQKKFSQMLNEMRAEANPWRAMLRRHTEEEKRLQHVIDTIDPKKNLDKQLEATVQWCNEVKKELFGKIGKLFATLKISSEDAKREIFQRAVQDNLKKMLSAMLADEKELTDILQRQSKELSRCYQIYQEATSSEYGAFLRFVAEIKSHQTELFKFIDEAHAFLEELAKKNLVLPATIRHVERGGFNKAHDEHAIFSVSSAGFIKELEKILSESEAALAAMAQLAHGHEKELGALQIECFNISMHYQALYDRYVPSNLDINKQIQSLSVQIHEKLTSVNTSFNANKGNVIAQLKRYLFEPNSSYQAVKSHIERLFEERGEVNGSEKTKLLELKAALKQLEDDIRYLAEELSKLDESCREKNLTLCSVPKSIMVNEVTRDAKLLVQFNEKYSRPISEGLVHLDALIKQCKSEQLKLESRQLALASSNSANEANMMAHLNRTLLVGNVCTLESSETYLSGELDALESIFKELDDRIRCLEPLQQTCINMFDIVANVNNFKRVIDEASVKDMAADFRAGINDYHVSAKRHLEELKQPAIWGQYQNEAFYKEQFNDVYLIQFNKEKIDKILESLLMEFSLLSQYMMVDIEPLREGDLGDAISKKSLDRYHEIREVIRLILDFLKQMPNNMLLDLQKEINTKAELSVIRSELIQDSYQVFLDEYKKLQWGGNIPVFASHEIDNMNRWPGDFEDAFAEFKGFANALIGVPLKSEDQSISSELDRINSAIKENLENSKKLQMRVSDLIAILKEYLAVYSCYEVKKCDYSVIQPQYEVFAKRLEGMVKQQLGLKGQLLECQNRIKQIIEMGGNVKGNRNALRNYHRNFQEGIGFNRKLIVGMVDRLGAEAQFKRKIAELLDSISALKKIKQSGFTRLRREFLFCGQSRKIITKLQMHRETVHTKSSKGALIESFLTNLFDENRFASIDELLAYLKHPFSDDQRNRELFSNTGWTNLGGRGKLSTTKELIKELRAELKLLRNREQSQSVNSVSYVLEKDCYQIESEISDLLDDKDGCGVSESLRLNKEYDDVLNAICKTYAVDEVEGKIQQDAVYIQRWFGPLGAEVAVAERIKQRAIHLQCAQAIRNCFQDEMNELRKQYPFIFSYHALRCHLEKSKTGRFEQKRKLWVLLDGIVFDKGTETEKYQKLKQAVLGIYSEVRESFNGSESYFFFGKGSRFGDALEQFLIGNEDTGAGLGYEAGEDLVNNQVSHRREAKGLDAAASWLRGNVFTCVP